MIKRLTHIRVDTKPLSEMSWVSQQDRPYHTCTTSCCFMVLNTKEIFRHL